jgi:hypothetical protein
MALPKTFNGMATRGGRLGIISGRQITWGTSYKTKAPTSSSSIRNPSSRFGIILGIVAALDPMAARPKTPFEGSDAS